MNVAGSQRGMKWVMRQCTKNKETDDTVGKDTKMEYRNAMNSKTICDHGKSAKQGIYGVTNA